MSDPTRLQITATFYGPDGAEGAVHTCETPIRMWQCLADRVQFERRFGVPADAYEAHRAVRTLPDEWFAFYGFRCLARGVQALSQMSFDDFTEQLLSLAVVDPDAPDEEEPASEPEADAVAPDPMDLPAEPASVP